MSGTGGNGKQHHGEKALEALGRFLADHGWNPRALDEVAGYSVGFEGDHGSYHCVAEILVEIQQFLFYVIHPVRVPAERRLAVAEAITRANYGMRIGNFELDFSDGEVRYKSSLDFDDEILTPPLIRNAIYAAVETMDRYARAIVAVGRGEKTAADAIAEVEGYR